MEDNQIPNRRFIPIVEHPTTQHQLELLRIRQQQEVEALKATKPEKTIGDYLFSICLCLLIGLGCQVGMWGFVTGKTLDPTTFSITNWFFQFLYIIVLVTLSYKVTKED